MKTFILLFALLIQSSVFAKELTVLVLEGWKSKPMAGCQVTLKSRVGQVLEEVKTDSLGMVVFTDLTYGYHSVVVESIDGNFIGTSCRISLEKNTEITLLLTPTRTFERTQLALEDSIYGKVKPYVKKSQRENEREVKDEAIDEVPEIDTTAQEATFQGGSVEMNRFIETNLIYPEISQELGDQGRVYVEFVIEPDGVITHVRLIRSYTEELDNEAKRLVRAMPNWNPSIANGKNVRTKCRLPLTFTLQ